MLQESGVWKIESNLKGRREWVSILIGLVGFLFLALAFYFIKHPEMIVHFSRPGASASQQANGITLLQWAGVFFLGLALVIYSYALDTTVLVDPRNKLIRIFEQSRSSRNSKTIFFKDIEKIRVDRRKLGKDSDLFGVYSYHLLIGLEDEKHIDTGRSGIHESEIAELATKLGQAIGCDIRLGPYEHPINSSLSFGGIKVNQIAVALAGAIVLYAIWFRVQVGPLCSAMWYGTAPPFVVGLGFLVILRILRRLPSDKF